MILDRFRLSSLRHIAHQMSG